MGADWTAFTILSCPRLLYRHRYSSMTSVQSKAVCDPSSRGLVGVVIRLSVGQGAGSWQIGAKSRSSNQGIFGSPPVMAERPLGAAQLAIIHHEALITPAKRSPSPEQQDLSGEASRRQLFQNKAAAGPAKAVGEEEEVQSKKRQCSEGDTSGCADVVCPSKGSQQRCRRLFGLPPSTERMDLYFQELEHQARSEHPSLQA